MDRAAKRFTGYGEHWLRINQERVESGLLLHENHLSAPWGPEHMDALQISHLEPLLSNPPEVFLLGTGRLTIFPSAEIVGWLREHRIAFECMDSRSAARTYNILLGEGRVVSIAMLLPGAD